MDIKVTVSIGTRTVPVEQVTDARIAAGLKSAGADVAKKLAVVKCPVHGKTASQVRLHFDSRGTPDLKYDACCEKLGKKIGEAFG